MSEKHPVKLFLKVVVFSFLKGVVSQSGQLGCPGTLDPCTEYDAEATLNRDTWFYFDSGQKDCVAVRSDCAVPVRDFVYPSQAQCRDVCGG